MLNDKIQQKLIDIFGDRVTFNRIERILYSTDLGTLPKMVSDQIDNMPDAIVQPAGNDDIQQLVELATMHHLPLVPRGAGTAGYGGAVPVKAGIIVDFYRMNAIVDIDAKNNTVTVESGMLWNNLQEQLNRHNLMLRLYPGSAISSTVGGWIATGGGVGIGSYEYGCIRDNLVEVEIITAKGVRKLRGDDLDLVDGMAGTTGLITTVTLMVREYDEEVPVLAVFPVLSDMVATFRTLREAGVPLWEAGYQSPRYVTLTRQAIETQNKKFPIQKHYKPDDELLPENGYTALFVYPRGRENTVRESLVHCIAEHNGLVLDEKLARQEWDNRFYPMSLKAIGPSIIPSEVVIPTDNLSSLIEHIGGNVSNIIFNGTLACNGDKATVLMYKLDDERRRNFVLAYSASFSPIKEASKLGGTPYTTGLFFTDSAITILGRDKIERAYRFRSEIDPDRILNPGKVFPRSLDKTTPFILTTMMKIARSQERVLRMTDNFLSNTVPGKNIKYDDTLKKLPFMKETLWDAFACANCGYCRSKCTLFNSVGWESSSPRGKFHFLREYIKGNVSMDERMAEMFYVCTTCNYCNEVCQIKSQVDEHWTLTARPLAWLKGYDPPKTSLVAACNIVVKHNPSGRQQDNRTSWLPPWSKTAESGSIGYFAGCNASFNKNNKNLPVNSIRILNKAGIEPAYLGTEEWCCGGGAYLAGCIADLEESVRHNILEFNRRGIKELVTSCGGCWYYLSHIYPIMAKHLNLEYNIRVKHITEIVEDLIAAGKIQFRFPLDIKVTYHDPCHIGRAGNIYDPPRNILNSIPGIELVEMQHNRENSVCCGRHIATRYPKLGRSFQEKSFREIMATDAPAVVSACPTCENNFRSMVTTFGSTMEVLDVTDLVAESMGLPTLVVSTLHRVTHNQPRNREKSTPVIYLTDTELAKEAHLLSPQKDAYTDLKGRKEDIRIIAEALCSTDEIPDIPASC